MEYGVWSGGEDMRVTIEKRLFLLLICCSMRELM
jgi:hypothetical protein